jgi:hypothetical protein
MADRNVILSLSKERPCIRAFINSLEEKLETHSPFPGIVLKCAALRESDTSVWKKSIPNFMKEVEHEVESRAKGP